MFVSPDLNDNSPTATSNLVLLLAQQPVTGRTERGLVACLTLRPLISLAISSHLSVSVGGSASLPSASPLSPYLGWTANASTRPASQAKAEASVVLFG